VQIMPTDEASGNERLVVNSSEETCEAVDIVEPSM